MEYPAVHIENDKHFCNLISYLLKETDKSAIERLLLEIQDYNKTDFLLAELNQRNVKDKEASEALSKEILGYVAKSSIEDNFRKE